MFKVKGKYSTATIYSDSSEDKAVGQILELCNQDFTKDIPIRIMPDYHYGAGCTIGFTANLGTKVVPNLVGVDIGCFAGDTKIPLLNGSQKTLKELVGTDSFYVYSLNGDGELVAGEAIAIKTRDNAQLVQVEISGGEKIVCTPDHKFMLKDLSYKEARDLKSNDSLMPLYRTYSTRDGYEHVFGQGRTHEIIAKKCFTKIPVGYVIHHKDSNKYNNIPENLEIMSAGEHSKFHAQKNNNSLRLKSDEFKANRKEKLEEGGYYNPLLYNKKKQVGIKNIASYMENNPEKFKEDVKNNGERGKKYLAEYNKSKEGRKKSVEIGSRIYKCSNCGREINGYAGFYQHEKKCKNNHKVISITPLEYTEDVYCLNVKTYHNFALSSGIFVHNCGMFVLELGKEKPDLEQLDNIMHKNIPSGFNSHDEPYIVYDKEEKLLCLRKLKKTYIFNRQIGTLGGGNHFVEVNIDEEENYYLVIHSGSRNLGKQVADYYQNMAIESLKGLGNLNELKDDLIKKLKGNNTKNLIQSSLKELEDKFKNTQPKYPRDLCYLEGQERDAYLNDMKVCQEYASLNRKTMANIITGRLFRKAISQFNSFEAVHNYIDFKDNIIRKGAVSAYEGEKLIIPINMRDGSLLCTGKGNPEWNYSAPHGAGRLMGRNEAKRTLKLEEFETEMKGIYSTSVGASTLDEAPMAYKSMQEIIDNVQDTVVVDKIIKPVYNFKAH